MTYRDALKTGARPEFLVIGNMSEAQTTSMARDIQKQLGANGSQWCRNKDVVVDKKQSVIFEKACWGRSYSRGSTINCVLKNS